MKKILITGATGLIGQNIVHVCHEKGICVHYLTTSKHKIEHRENYKGFLWDPSKNSIDTACFEGVEVIINLAGATISKRWTSSYKTVILDSRIDSLNTLYTGLKNTTNNISHLISASAIGIYPDSLTNYYDESEKSVSSSFLGDVVSKWESAADTFKTLGLKISKVRIGLVLDNKEGALPQIAKPVALGLGAAFGHGNQWQSWIHVTDLARLFVFVAREQLEGVYNGVAPNPVSNKELTNAVAKQLKRPLWLPNIPKSIMRLLLGDMHILLFESQRVSSKKIEEAGFSFKYHALQPALQELL
ncbi:TIGR01777 family oxidoreductase [Mangrovimonas cancribranchiae]|uniref:TIGR01777 family oxidoreductase n=1 Tax=Mangrovimonas cancribranchiae TaxID=3080055 RepID=A0AAU6P1R0_9FLAO